MTHTRPPLLRPLAAALALAALSGLAQADDSWYLNLGPAIKGDLTAPTDRVGQIALDGVSWSVTAESSWTKGGGASVGKPNPGSLRWSQGWDTSIYGIQTDILTGKSVTKAVFEQAKPLKGKSLVGLGVTAEQMYFTDVSQSLQGFDVQGVAKKFTVSVDPTAWGLKGPKVTLDWDVASGQVHAATRHAAWAITGDHSAAVNGSSATAYLNIGDTAGFSTAVGYENWIDVSSMGWDITAATSWVKGGGASVGKPKPNKLTWTQSLDATLPVALTHITQGAAVPEIRLEFVRTQGAGPVTFMQQVFKDAFYTEVSFNGDQVTESVEFKSVVQTIWQIDKDGKRTGDGKSFTFNLVDGTLDASGGPVTSTPPGFGKGLLDGSPVTLAGTTAPPLPAPLPVPEPQTWLMMLAGGALLAVWLRRRPGATTV